METMTESEVLHLSWFLARKDLWFLLKYVLSTSTYFFDGNGVQHEEWLFDRCRQVQEKSDRILDVWARFHWKSNIKTLANTIRYILNDPEVTTAIFSHTRPIAKGFLSQIQREIKFNELLKKLSWDPSLEDQIFPDNPGDLVRDSLDEGIICNRKSNPREATIEAWGLVDSQPIGRHYKLRVYDDVVTINTVSTSDMIKKTTEAWELSLALGMPGDEIWYTGTFYSHADTYHELLKRGTPLRLHPCYEIDKENSRIDTRTGHTRILKHHMDQPVLYYEDHLQQLFTEMGFEEGSRTASMQMLCDPSAGLHLGFDEDDLRYYQRNPRKERRGKTCYILVDPANEKKKDSDYTSMWVVCLGSDGNRYVIDGVRDRLNLEERTKALFRLHRRWGPVKEVRYEAYGLQTDIQHIKYVQEHEGYRFRIVPVAGKTKKLDRIERLVPITKRNELYFPEDGIEYVTVEGEQIDLVDTFIAEELRLFPNCKWFDMLDSLARIEEPDMHLVWPRQKDERYTGPSDARIRWEQNKVKRPQGTWMSR